jgi:hypothetical protein
MTNLRKQRGPKAQGLVEWLAAAVLRMGVSAWSSNFPELSCGGLTHSASIAVYRAQVDLFEGRSDGKLVVRLEKD